MCFFSPLRARRPAKAGRKCSLCHYFLLDKEINGPWWASALIKREEVTGSIHSSWLLKTVYCVFDICVLWDLWDRASSHRVHCLSFLFNWQSNKFISRKEMWQASTHTHWSWSHFVCISAEVSHTIRAAQELLAADTYGRVIVCGPAHPSDPSTRFTGSVFNAYCVNSHLLSVHTDVCWRLNGSVVSPDWGCAEGAAANVAWRERMARQRPRVLFTFERYMLRRWSKASFSLIIMSAR